MCDISNSILENIFGEYFYISNFSKKTQDVFTDNFFEELNNSFNFDTWSLCDTKSSFFHDELLDNYNPLNVNDLLNTEIISHCKCFLTLIENDMKMKNKLSFNIGIEQLWHNIYKNNSFQEIHSHSGPNATFSFVYIAKLESNTNSSELFFINPRQDIFSMNRFSKYFKDSKNYMDMYIPELKQGDIIIFPSHISHGVSLHKEDSHNRITISGNLKMNIN